MVTTDVDLSVFIDTNILIQLHVDAAPRHIEVFAAIDRLIEDERQLWISRQVLREYASVLTRPQPYAPPLSAREVSRQLRFLEARYLVADEDAVTTAALRELLDTIPMGGKQIHDANIVATMLTNGITHLLTLNTVDFVRFSELITLVNVDELLT